MTLISQPTKQLLRLMQLSGVGPATLKKVVQLPGFSSLDIEVIAKNIPAISRAIATPSAWEIAINIAEEQIHEADKTDTRILSVSDTEYPKLLATTKDDPLLIFVRGNLAAQQEKSVAIIGTREPTLHGQLIARRVTEFFVDRGWSIVSGLAIGCDAIAHETALNVGGHTVAVLAHGLQMIAPARHRKLADRILEAGGALLSEYQFGQGIQKSQYVKRDRTQAGLAQGVVMIQSDLIGGSLHASRAALDYDRWLAVPYPTDKDRGNNEPKIQANLMLAEGSLQKRAELLRCEPRKLDDVLILKSRNDYLGMVEPTMEIRATVTSTGSLLDSNLSANTKLNEQGISEEIKIAENNNFESNNAPDLLYPNIGKKSMAMAVHEHDHSNTYQAAQPHSNNWLQNWPQNEFDPNLEYPAPVLLSVPSKDDANLKWRRFAEDNPHIAMALAARLNYVKLKMEEVDKAYKNFARGNPKHELLALVIDDFISQLEHATELLIALEATLSPSESPGDNHHQSSFAPAFLKQKDGLENCGLKISEQLIKLKNQAAHRLLRASTSSYLLPTQPHYSEADKFELKFSDLCETYNSLVRQILWKQ